jgi:hypothetical protein
MEKNINRFIVNLGLFVFGIASAFSGMLIQVKYHMGNHGNIAINDSVFGINYHGWSFVHKISIVVLSLLMIYHIYQHWKWYKIVITKRLLVKNQQVLIFSLLFVLVVNNPDYSMPPFRSKVGHPFRTKVGHPFRSKVGHFWH